MFLLPENSEGDLDTDGVGLRILRARFSSFSELSEEEDNLLVKMSETVHYHPPHRSLYPRSLTIRPLRMIIAGWGCRYRLLSNGRRQIINLCLPGDFVGHVFAIDVPTPYSIGALTEMQTVNASSIASLLSAHDGRFLGLSHAMRVMSHVEDIMMCDQILRLGRQTGPARLSHLVLRLHERLTRLDLAKGNRFAMPLTQEVLADVLGQSHVHMNRIIRDLRKNNLLDLRAGVAEILDIDRLRAMAAWVPLPAKVACRSELVKMSQLRLDAA